MIKQFFAAATIVAALASVQTEASFVHTDWKTEGDKKAVLDLNTGIEWLNILETRNQSINQVLLRIESGDLHGWRLPTYQEIKSLWSSATSINLDDSRGTHRNINMTFSSMIGQFASSGYLYAIGYGYSYDGTVKDFGTSSFSNTYYHAWNNATSGSTNTTRGVWLVSDGGTTLSSINNPMLNINNPNAPINQGNPAADVASPAGLAAAGALLMLLGARRRKLRG